MTSHKQILPTYQKIVNPVAFRAQEQEDERRDERRKWDEREKNMAPIVLTYTKSPKDRHSYKNQKHSPVVVYDFEFSKTTQRIAVSFIVFTLLNKLFGILFKFSSTNVTHKG